MNIYFNHTIITVTLGALLLGLMSGCLGTFAVLRRQSLLGDAISHSTLPGVAFAFMLTQSKSPVVLLLGAALAGWLGAMSMMFIVNNSRLKKDAALGIVLSVFFGLGLMLLTMIQSFPGAQKAGLNKFLFGSAATLLTSDLYVMIVLAVINLTVLLLFWKEFKLVTFDEGFANSQGIPSRRIEIMMTTMIVIAIVTGLQLVGVVLMSAMLVAPASAARQWTDRLGVMVILSALFGAVAGVFGSVTSAVIPKLPTGPVIVVFVSVIVFISLLFAPHRGLVWDWLRLRKQRQSLRMSTMLKNLLLFSEIKTNPFHAHDLSALRAIGKGGVRRTMQDLEERGWAREDTAKRWALTPEGLKIAQRIDNEGIMQ